MSFSTPNRPIRNNCVPFHDARRAADRATAQGEAAGFYAARPVRPRSLVAEIAAESPPVHTGHRRVISDDLMSQLERS